jgi:hypothetical protein
LAFAEGSPPSVGYAHLTITDKTKMKKIEALEIEEQDLEDKRWEGMTSPRWKLSEEARNAVTSASLVMFSGQVVKNRGGRITAQLDHMLMNW